MPSPRQGPADPRTCPPRTLPGINPFLNHRDPAHKASFDSFLRSATASRRGPALALRLRSPPLAATEMGLHQTSQGETGLG